MGRIQGITAGKIVFAQDLKENLAKADQFETDFVVSKPSGSAAAPILVSSFTVQMASLTR